MTSDVYELTISAPGRNAISSVLTERMIADPWTTVARVVVPITRATSEMYADTDRNLPSMAILCGLLGAKQLEHRLERLLSISLEFSLGKLELCSFMGSEICEQTRVSFRMFPLETLEKPRSVASHDPEPAEHDAPRKVREQGPRGVAQP